MSGYYVNLKNEYYVGDKQDSRHSDVPERPTKLHVWDGSKWIESSELITDNIKQQLKNTDKAMIRGVDDLIEILIVKNIFTFDELPEDLQLKYNERKSLRESIIE